MSLYPKLSVLIPNRDHGKFLRACVESQPSIATEIILVDDGSTDGSLRIVEELVREGYPITSIENSSPLGVVSAMNQALHHASGDYVVFRAADDLSVSSGILEAVELLDTHPDFCMACGNLGYFLEKPEQASIERPFEGDTVLLLEPDDLVNLDLDRAPIHAHTVVYRRQSVLDLGGFREEHAYYSDWYLTICLSLSAGVIYMPRTMALARLHAASYANKGSRVLHERMIVSNSLRTSIDGLSETLRDRIYRSRCLDFFNPLPSAEYPMNGPTLSIRNTGIAGRIADVLGKEETELLIKENGASIYWIGAGTHTFWLSQIWGGFEYPSPVCIWSQDAQHRDRRHWGKYQLEEYGKELNGLKPTLFVISSKSYEPEMKDWVSENYPRIPCLCFWSDH